jgi:hypothetical protein
MEGDSTTGFDMTAYKYRLAKGITDVMPDSAECHARVYLHENEAVPDQIEEKTLAKALAIADKKGVAPKKAAQHLAKHIAQKRAQKEQN